MVLVTSHSVQWTIDISGLVFLFVFPEEYKYRILLFLPSRTSKTVILIAPTKGRSVVNCGANRTCFQPCSKLVLPPPPCQLPCCRSVGQAVAEQAAMAAAGRQRRLEGKQRDQNVFIP